MKMVIYKSLGCFCMTDYENYNSYITNARKVQRLEDFNSVQEIIDYYCKYFKSKPEDFIIID